MQKKEVNYNKIALSALGIHKSFSSIEVLHGVDFNLKIGEVHGLLGENGAGKSTLIKILGGVYKKNKGRILINDIEVDYDNPISARQHGIAVVFQEFSLIPTMTVVENIFLGRELCKGPFTNDKAAYEHSIELLKKFGIQINPRVRVEQLPVYMQQIVEIAKAVSQNASIIIMDEPAASLSDDEVQYLFSFIRSLKEQDVSVIYVSHHLNEIIEICDRATVLRDGNVVLSDDIKNLSLDDLVLAIVGKKLTGYNKASSKRIFTKQPPLLEVNNLVSNKNFYNISFRLYRNEILGLPGLLGSGITELLRSIYGLHKLDDGQIIVNGKTYKTINPKKAIEIGIFYVPENRRKQGLILGQSIYMNMLLPIWEKITKTFLILDNKGKQIAEKLVSDLNIDMRNVDQLVDSLSGGNRQKVLFAKGLASNPTILLLNDPSVGVDVGTRNQIITKIKNIAETGKGVVVASSDMDELTKLCDRILVFSNGKIVKEITNVQKKKISEEMLVHAIHSKY